MVVRRAARAAGTGIGATIGSAFSTPAGFATIAAAAIIILLVIFRDRIGGFFENALKIPPIELPTINLPTINLPEINFPEFPEFPELPDFSGFFQQQTDFLSGLQLQFNNLFGGGGLEQPQKMVEDTGLIEDPAVTCPCGSSIVQDAFGNVNQTCKACAAIDTALPSQDPALNVPVLPAGTGLGGIFGGIFNFLGLTPAQQFQQDKIEAGEAPPVQSFLVDQPTQQFEGGGLSFIGGSVNPTPIQNLSLSQIIDMFNVTASQAANLKAIAQGFTPEEEEFLQGSQDIIGFTGFNPPAVSDQQFAGLTPQQIALQLTGGNISNF